MKPLRLALFGIPTVLLGAGALLAGAVFVEATVGNAPAQFLIGSTYQFGLHDFAAATKWYRASAAQGYALAELHLGNIYAVSDDKMEQAKARYWLSQAAEQDNALAQFFLGNLYLLGKGGPRNLVEGAKWTFLSLRHPTPLIDKYGPDSLKMIQAALSKDEQKRAHDLAESWQPKPRSVPADAPE